MLTFKQTLALVFLLLSITSPFQTLSAQTLDTRIDSLILTVFKDKDGPGAVFMVAQQEKIIYEKAFGKANLELEVDLSTESVF